MAGTDEVGAGKRIGELLVRQNLITIEQLNQALVAKSTQGGRLGEILVNLGFIKEEELLQFLSRQYNVSVIDLNAFEPDPKALEFISREIALEYLIMPLNIAASALIIAVADPSNISTIDYLAFKTGYKIEVLLATESAIKEAIEKHYVFTAAEEEGTISIVEEALTELVGSLEVAPMEAEEEKGVDLTQLKQSAEDAPIIRLVNEIFRRAIRERVSDIHLEPMEKDLRLRFRIDGILHQKEIFRNELKSPLVARVKIISNLDITERRLPQDGRITLKVGNRGIEVRVSILPSIHGESVVMRLLDRSSLELDMMKLGFEQGELQLFKAAIDMPYGMVLVTGPTGSGKTTTLYSALMELNQVADKILTVEDPVEYSLAGIIQTPVNEDIGMTFAAALRSFLRHDPDIILVGEIRDFETVEIAIKAALTGHLVLSTLHTNDASSAITRLLNMGVEPFLITASTNLILAQRLLRRICPECKEKEEISYQTLIDLGVPPNEAKNLTCYKGKGCKNCLDTGYRGRIGVFEVLALTESLKELIMNGASANEIKAEAIRMGMRSLRKAAINKLIDGEITVEEVAGNTSPD